MKHSRAATVVPEPQPDGAAYTSPAYAWYVVIVLLLVIGLSFLDKHAMSILVTPMQADLGLTDTQSSLIIGPAFTLFYAVAGMPMGLLADRHSRRNLLVAGVATWSIATAMCGIGQDFWSILLARSMVGLGEACVVPAIFSLVSDYFPPAQRGRATAVVTIGSALGSAMALLGGGFFLSLASNHANTAFPVIGARDGWELVLIGFGLLGLLIALLALTIREPSRKGATGQAIKVDTDQPGLIAFLRQHPLGVAMVLGPYIMLSFAQNAGVAWQPTILTRRYGLSPAEAASLLGLILLIVAPSGAIFGGIIADWLARRRPNGRFLLVGLATPFFLPGVALITLSPSIELAIVGLVMMNGVSAVVHTTVYAAVQEVAPAAVRGRFLALYGLLALVFGMGTAPFAVALVTDQVFGDRSMVNMSLLTIAAPIWIVTLLVCWRGMRHYRHLRDGAARQDAMAG